MLNAGIRSRVTCYLFLDYASNLALSLTILRQEGNNDTLTTHHIFII